MINDFVKIMNKEKIIIDTDPGQDDALAIMILEKSELFDIRAITTVAGNSSIENVTNNARYILDLIGSSTPLFSGASSPLKRELIQANVHGEGGLGGVDIKKKEPLSGDAVERIIETVKQNPREVTVLALGPLTNVAKAIKRDPTITSDIKRIVVMGGAITAPGNKSRVAEFNIFVDPEAAEIVFETETEKILVPLDVCNDVFLEMKDFEKLKGSDLYETLKAMMDCYIEGILKFEKIKKAIMYDPLTAYYLINPDSFETKETDVRIETKGELTRGMTVAERRTGKEGEYNVRVATQASRKSFTKDFFKILKK